MTAMNPRPCVLVLLLLLTASPVGAQGIASMLPPDTLAHVEINGEPFHRVGGRLAIARIMAEPEVQAFLHSLEGLTDAGYEQLRGMLEQVGLELDDVLELTRGRITVSFLGMTPQSMPDVVVTCNLKHAKDAGLRLVDALGNSLLQSSGTEPKRIDIGGRSGILFTFKSGPPLAYVVADGLVLAGTNPDSLGQMLGRMDGADEPDLAGTPSWTRVATELCTKNDVVYIWANVRGLFESFGESMPQEAGMLLRSYGLDSIAAIGYAFTLDGAAFRDRAFMLAPELKGFLALLKPKANATLVADRVVPAETVLFSQTALDLGAMLDWGIGVAEMYEFDLEPGTGEGARAQVAALSDQVGFDLKKDFLDLLGPEFASYAALSGQALVPDIGLLARVSDATKVEVNLTRLVQELGGVPVKTFEYQGTKMSYADLGGSGLDWDEMPPLKPTWAVVNDHLLITLWPQSAKNLVRGLKAKDPRLADKPDYKRLLAHIRERNPAAGNAGREYLDVKRLVGFVMDNGVPFAQSLIPSLPGMPGVEWAAFPSTETVTQHLFGVMGATTWTKDGAETEYLSPTGVLPFYVGIVAVAGIASLRVSVPFFESQHDLAMMDIAALKQAVKLYQLKEGRLPHESEWPKFLFEGSKKHPLPYIDTDYFVAGALWDPWASPYVYKKSSARGFEIISYGADGTPGGEGNARDISSKREK